MLVCIEQNGIISRKKLAKLLNRSTSTIWNNGYILVELGLVSIVKKFSGNGRPPIQYKIANAQKLELLQQQILFW